MVEVQKLELFVVETEVYPGLAELEAVLQNPAKHWYRRGRVGESRLRTGGKPA
jgi:hypothetical protein